MSSSEENSALRGRLLQLECRFTWALSKEDLNVDKLGVRLQGRIDQGLGQEEGVARFHSFLAHVRYLQGKSKESMDLLCKSMELTREHFGEDSERQLIVLYADMAWLYYHTGDYTQSQTYCQMVEGIKEKYPTGAAADLLPEVYGEKGWTFLKFSYEYRQKAMDCFRNAVKLQPDHKEWNIGYAIALYRMHEEFSSAEQSQAIQQLRRARDLNPEDGLLMVLLALKLVIYRKYREAEDLVERALTIDPDGPHIEYYVAKYVRQPRLERMAYHHVQANVQDAEAYGLLGLVCRAEGDRVSAVKWYQKAVDCDVDNEDYLSALRDLEKHSVV